MISLKKIKFRLEKTKTSSIQNFYNNSELLANSKNGLDVYSCSKQKIRGRT